VKVMATAGDDSDSDVSDTKIETREDRCKT
jgi:hypothetical protein